MRIVLINWIFILLTTYSTGYIFLKILLKIFGINSKKQDTDDSLSQEKYIAMLPAPNIIIILLGLAVVTAYAQIWSLFSGVATWADYILMIFSLIVMIFNSKHIGKLMTVESKPRMAVYIVLTGLFAYGTSRGYMHYDTNLYHAQAIRWIEDFGVIPGLANLQSRFGYNSSEFALNALYSWRWYLGQSLHTTAGFFALLSSVIAADIGHIWRDKNEQGKRIINIRLSDFVRLGLIFYLGIIFSEIISPASDYYAQLLIFDIIILWLDMDDISTRDSDRFTSDRVTEYRALLCILIVYAITIKLSIGLLVLLAIIPGISWIKTKKIRNILGCVMTGLLIVIPYFIRNHIISGWILYPSTLLKIGSPDWQLPKGEVQYDAKEIGMWGRGITRAEDWENVTFFNWIGDWFGGLQLLEKVWVTGTAVAIIAVIIIAIIKCINYKKDSAEGKKEDIGALPVMTVLSVGTIFWFCSAPLVRYGYAYLMIMPLITVGYILGIMAKNKNGREVVIRNAAFLVMAVIVVGLKGKGLISDILRTKDADYYIMQQDYIDGEATTYEVDGITIYVAKDSGQIGYYKFPATPEVNNNFELRTDDVNDGFRHKD